MRRGGLSGVAGTRAVRPTRAGLGAQLGYPANIDAFIQAPRIDPATLRIGYTEDFGACAVDPSIRAAFREKIARLSRLVGHCEPVAFDLREAHRVFDVVRAQEFVASLRETYERDPSLLGANTRANYEMALTLADVARADAQRTALYRQFQAHFARYDVIVAPVSPVSPFPWTTPHCEEIDGERLENYYRWVALTYIVTVLTNPSLSLPCGVDHAGMPFGLQMIGPIRGDARLLDIAQTLEAAFARDPALARPVPDLQRLSASDALRSIITDPPAAQRAY
jgi:amidase